MKHLKALVAAAAVSAAVIGFPLAQKALAWSAQDHLLAEFNIPTNLNQTQANTWCQDAVYWRTARASGTFVDAGHSGSITFAPFTRPYVFGHLNLRKCVIVASWGYLKGPGHN